MGNNRKMETINIGALRQGITYTSDLMIDNAFLLLPKTAEMTEDLIKALRQWGFEDILVDGSISLGGGIGVNKEEESEEEVPKEKIKFDFGMVNCNSNLKDLTKKLKASKQTNYGILLYGESGCGKSYFGQYLAQELGMPIIKKRASDLIDKFVGQTERNIKEAFKEARQDR